jgi:adenylosuccinate synthase
LWEQGTVHKFHLIPSGILNPKAACVIGNGVVVHMPQLIKELEDLEKKQISYTGRFLISDRAHLVFDFHQAIDGYNEDSLGRNKIGTYGLFTLPLRRYKAVQKLRGAAWVGVQK